MDTIYYEENRNTIKRALKKNLDLSFLEIVIFRNCHFRKIELSQQRKN
ncbi:hypothetical protein NGH54_10735 [Staphylococcus xylosus]|nr:hypothetical protein [Staphylococcus xylosus]MEB8071199.1 hypothetical protein [Staphylococcus xylosus]